MRKGECTVKRQIFLGVTGFLCYNYKKQYSAEIVECLGNGKS